MKSQCKKFWGNQGKGAVNSFQEGKFKEKEEQCVAKAKDYNSAAVRDGVTDFRSQQRMACECRRVPNNRKLRNQKWEKETRSMDKDTYKDGIPKVPEPNAATDGYSPEGSKNGNAVNGNHAESFSNKAALKHSPYFNQGIGGVLARRGVIDSKKNSINIEERAPPKASTEPADSAKSGPDCKKDCLAACPPKSDVAAYNECVPQCDVSWPYKLNAWRCFFPCSEFPALPPSSSAHTSIFNYFFNGSARPCPLPSAGHCGPRSPARCTTPTTTSTCDPGCRTPSRISAKPKSSKPKRRQKQLQLQRLQQRLKRQA